MTLSLICYFLNVSNCESIKDDRIFSVKKRFSFDETEPKRIYHPASFHYAVTSQSPPHFSLRFTSPRQIGILRYFSPHLFNNSQIGKALIHGNHCLQLALPSWGLVKRTKEFSFNLRFTSVFSTSWRIMWSSVLKLLIVLNSISQ